MQTTTTLGKRLRLIRNTQSREKFGMRYNVHRNTLARWEDDERLPDLEFIRSLAKEHDISLDWLLNGEGPQCASERKNIVFSANPIPIFGLTEITENNYWYTPVRLALSIAPPNTSSDIFAVFAITNALRSAGVSKGNLIYCEPSFTPLHGDIVYTLTTSDKAAICVYVQETPTSVTLSHGNEEEIVERKYIQLIAPVTYTRKRI